MSQDQNKEQNMRRVARPRSLAPASSGMTFSSTEPQLRSFFQRRFSPGSTADGAPYYFL